MHPDHPDLDLGSLLGLARVALTLTTLVFALATLRHLARGEGTRPVVVVVVGVAALAIATSLAPSRVQLVLLPGGVFVGLALALSSLAHEPTRRAFDALDDGAIRALLGYRATFGAFLVAGAALGVFPPIFAWTAGLGDLLVTWLAHLAPGSLARDGARLPRLVVHGVGLLDLAEVVIVAMTIVRPWLFARLEHDPTFFGPPLALPWLGVPLMLALNLHGLRALRAHASGVAA
ncbi:MAG: hypothetical protein U0353_07415 [Sandaracinus sp.]|jgi:hypothetical protein